MTELADKIRYIAPMDSKTVTDIYSRAFTLSKQDAQEAVRLLAESHERLRLELESKCQQQEMM